MIRLEIQYDRQGQKHNHTVVLGEPKPGNHPLMNQANWLATSRGGTIPQEVMDSINSLKKFSEDNELDFEEVCKLAYDDNALTHSIDEKKLSELRSIKVFGRFLN